jgi:hypothetical protein
VAPDQTHSDPSQEEEDDYDKTPKDERGYFYYRTEYCRVKREFADDEQQHVLN